MTYGMYNKEDSTTPTRPTPSCNEGTAESDPDMSPTSLQMWMHEPTVLLVLRSIFSLAAVRHGCCYTRPRDGDRLTGFLAPSYCRILGVTSMPRISPKKIPTG